MKKIKRIKKEFEEEIRNKMQNDCYLSSIFFVTLENEPKNILLIS